MTEMTCINCGATRGLTFFSKAQRSNPDGAVSCEPTSLKPYADICSDAWIVCKSTSMQNPFSKTRLSKTGMKHGLHMILR